MKNKKGTPLWRALLLEHRLPWRYNQLLKKINYRILKLLGGDDISYMYNKEFAKYRRKKYAKYFCELLLKEFNPHSVIDFGCGTGDMIAPFEKKGIKILGVDGSKANKKYSRISDNNFQLYDLRKKYYCKEKYDLCLCLEVAEHIEEKYSGILVDTLVSSSSTIFFTAAPPGQGGIDHCNEKPPNWWIKKFRKVGFELDKQCTNRLKKEMRKILGIDTHYIDNLLIFKEKL